MLCWWCPFFLIFFEALLWDQTKAVCDPSSNGYKLFGSECEYMCHCINNNQCDNSTGECMVGCTPGWTGPGCQYVDIAYGAYVVMKTDPSMLTPMDLLQDEDKLKCNIYSALGRPSISFTFSGPVEISIIQIYYDASKLFSPYKLYIKKGSAPAKLCYEKINATSSSTSEFMVKVESIKCSQPMIGDYLEIFNNGSNVEFPLCEIDIPIGRNVAFGRAVYQSSDQEMSHASKAVDGNVEGEANQLSCAQTSNAGTSNPWWYVDLQTTWRLKNLLVYSPGADGSAYRTMMSHFQVSASRTSSHYSMTLLYDNGGKPVKNITYISGLPDTDYHYVKIIIPGDNQILSLCEVQVLSDCPEKSCGLLCDIPCNCKSYNFYGQLSGICNGCEAGWTGSGADMCDIPCSSGRYGENCAFSCGHCAGGFDCDIHTGNCSEGCETGWGGPNCDTSCPWGFYGPDCGSNCSGHCLGNVTCELATGVCPSGACAPGYFTATCSQSCLWGSYGLDCGSSCSGHCRGNVTCDLVTGMCPGGLCIAGFHTAACSKSCSSGYYGENCATQCGHCYEHVVCDRYTGDCPGGCDSGYRGQKCDIATTKSTETDPMTNSEFPVPFTSVNLLSESDQPPMNIDLASNYEVVFDEFYTTYTPMAGNCSITPSIGYSLLTVFTISCEGFNDPDDNFLMYNLYYRNPQSFKDILLRSNMTADESKVTLYNPGDDPELSLIVRVVDPSGASIDVNMLVQVFGVGHFDNETDLIGTIEEKLNNQSEVLKQMLFTWSALDVIHTLTVISYTLNDISRAESLTGKFLSEIERRKNIREEIIQIVKDTPVRDIITVISTAQLVNEVVLVREEVTEQLNEDASDMYKNITNAYLIAWKRATWEEVEHASSLLLSGYGHVIRCNIQKVEDGDLASHGDGADRKEAKLNNTGEIFENIDFIVDVLLEFQVPDQPAVTLNTSFMSVTVMKRLPKSITSINLEQSRMIAGHVVTGNITLPNAINYLPDFREKSDFELKVLFLDENPYIVDDNNSAITSTVIGISVKDRRGNIIDIEEAENETIIQIPNPKSAFLPQSENDTFSINLTSREVALSKASLNMLLFNFSLEENKTCMLKVSTDNEDIKLKLLLQRGRYPTLEEVVRDGVGFPQDPSLLASDGNLQQDEYTLFLNYIYSINERSSFSRSQRSLDNVDHCKDSLDDKCTHQLSLDYLNTFYVGITLDLDKINITEVFNISPEDTCTEGNCDTNASVSVDIGIMLAATSCILWDEKELHWKSDTCMVLPYTTADMIHCACRKLPPQKLNLFAGSVTAKHFMFFVAPNELDPVKDIYLFLTVVENPVVVTSVVLVWITYFSLLYWARRTDRLNKEKIGVVACKDNHPSHQYMYVVCVVTGWWMRAGTTANVYMYMSGLAGTSPVYCLSRTKRTCFQSGAEDWILVTTKRSLDVLKSITVWHDNTGPSPEWYLTQIVIKDVQTQKHWTFLYSDWLAVDRGVLVTTSTTLEPVSQEEMKKRTKQNFIITSSHEIRNSHLWISIFSKTTRDSFSHVQRLTCALSLLLSNMLANIMFFGIPTDQPEHQLNVTKGITVSLSSILIGIESSLIIFPINTLILQFFTNLKPKPKAPPKLPLYLLDSVSFKTEEHKEKQDETISAQTVVDCEETKHEEYQQNRFAGCLPWWFVYIGWSLAITTSLISSYLVMLYGLKFGYEKSLNWLVSFFTALTNSTCVIQPVKVLAIAALLTLILKRTLQFEDFGPGQQLEKDEEYIEETLVGKKRKRYKKQKPLSQKMIAAIRKRIWLEWLLNTTLQDMVLYSIFLAVVLIVVHGHRNITVSFQCTKTVENAFINRGKDKERGLSEVSDVKSVLQYLNEVLLPRLAKLNRQNSLNSLASFCLVGTARLRQVRVNKGPCDKRIRSYFHNVSLPSCVAEYTMGNEDTRNYNGSWLYPIKNGSPENSGRWTYQTSLKLKTLPFSGLRALYSGGGFVAELPPHFSDQEAMLQTIKESDWIDDGTKGLFVEFTLYNPNVNMFSVVILLFEFTNVGRVFPFHKVFTTKLYHYTNGFEVFVAVCEVAFLIFTIGLTVVESKRLRKLGRKKYLNDIWNVVQILQITLSYSIIGVFFQRMVIIKFIMNEFTTSRGKKFINFYTAVTWDIILGYMSAFLVLIMIIKVLKLLRFSKRFFMLIDTLSVARTHLLHFGIELLVLFLSFGLFAVLAFGKEQNEFRNVWTCLMYLINFSLGMSDFSSILEINWILGPVFFCTFIVIIQWCFLTMFVAILNISIHKSKKNLKKKRNKFQLIQYMKRKWMENISKRFAFCR